MSAEFLGPERAQRAAANRAQAEAELNAGAPDFLRRFPLQPYIDELDHHGATHRFWDFTPKALALFQQMTADFAPAMVETYHRLLLADLITQSTARAKSNVPQSVRPFILENFDRILSAMDRPRSGYYSREVHLFRRDLAMCRLKLIPCGSEVLDLNVSVDRRAAFRAGPAVVAQYLRAYGPKFLGPLAPIYELHWDRRLTKYFSEPEFRKCYLRVADLVRANPAVHAVTAGESWWYDDALRELAPDMMFLRKIPEEGGAHFIRLFHENSVVTNDAIAFSPERKALYDAGRYRPKNYAIVWPRRELLAWADRCANGAALS